MTREWHLLGIFHYRNPEARARRIAKTAKEAVTFAKRSSAGVEKD